MPSELAGKCITLSDIFLICGEWPTNRKCYGLIWKLQKDYFVVSCEVKQYCSACKSDCLLTPCCSRQNKNHVVCKVSCTLRKERVPPDLNESQVIAADKVTLHL